MDRTTGVIVNSFCWKIISIIDNSRFWLKKYLKWLFMHSQSGLCINWARFSANFTHKVNEQFTQRNQRNQHIILHCNIFVKTLQETVNAVPIFPWVWILETFGLWSLVGFFNHIAVVSWVIGTPLFASSLYTLDRYERMRLELKSRIFESVFQRPTLKAP